MEGNFQTSFIPRKPGAPMAQRHHRSVNIATIVASILLVSSILVAIGVFGYKIYLTKNVTALNDTLQNKLSSLNTPQLDQLTRLDSRITLSKELIAQHTAVQAFLNEINSATLRSIRFTDFSYEEDDSGIKVTLDGEAPNFSAIVLESGVLDTEQNKKYFQNSQFSNISLDKSGNVIFELTADINPSSILYKNTLTPTAS